MTAQVTHFERLGVPAAPDVDLAVAERNYLRLSRALHPDFQAPGDEAAAERANDATARLNEAWSVISDPEARAEYLLELRDPGILDRAKTLSPAFLAEAMELSEEAETARRDPAAARALRARVQADADARLASVLAPAAWGQPDTRRLATTLHELRVLRRVLRDLGSP
ncbi:MAG TPA: DnaJ domain-containing protein [Planctomycetota bacterium]|nr:DnaJ domain-containing protein [Planctomycetota bacterium]